MPIWTARKTPLWMTAMQATTTKISDPSSAGLAPPQASPVTEPAVAAFSAARVEPNPAPAKPRTVLRQYELVDKVRAYDPGIDEDALNKAYVFAMKAHGTQTRASGDPYFSHPVEVAGILAEMRLDTASIITGLLHDTIEDTGTSYAQIESAFGKEIAKLVDGVTKLSRLEHTADPTVTTETVGQAENFRKLLLAMSEDIRVLLIKLADRLHNMRTLHYLSKPEKRRRIARETLDIYAPLAERIGISKIKEELEDLSFAELNKPARDGIVNRLAYLREQESGDLIQRIAGELQSLLGRNDLQAKVVGREKSPYSIFKKMENKRVTFEQLADIMAFRVIVNDVGHCYQALGLIHGRYPVVPGRFKDYISTPKPNGYQSLHTTVLGPEGRKIEIQIRTQKMHEVAELGVAAHWVYKTDTPGAYSATERSGYRWLRELLEIVDNAQRPDEFLEHTKLELFQDQVFCFTPKGDVIALPRGATAIDFAYAIHSGLGDRTVGAKVNGRMVQLSHVLENGDQVDIVTSSTQTPSPGWERFAVTGKAKARVRRFVRLQQRDEYIRLGRELVQKVFRQEDYEFTEKAVAGALKVLRQESVDDVYAAVGSGTVTSRDVFHAIFPGHRSTVIENKPIPAPLRGRAKGGKDKPLPIKGLIPGLAVHFARCCHPVPGDRIVGIVTTGKGVAIHTIDCETLETFSDMPERWIDVAWEDDDGAEERFVGRLTVTISNEQGSLGTLSTVIAKNGGNINNLRIVHRTTDYWEMLLDILVDDRRQLTNIVAALRATPSVITVERTQGR
jgi:GTP pyrophosphokinase